MATDSVASLPHAAHRLVTWYRENHRALPWRQTSDPYRILVSETMLQQTRVETVVPYYHRFLETFPTLQALAQADEESVLKMWQGLGYYSRARNLQKAARMVMERYNGHIPADEAAVRGLPGVGPYTTGAVMSIAFHQPVPAVDGNVLRVLARHRGIHESIQSTAVKRQVTEYIADWISHAPPAEFTQSVMELGATVCTPRSPSCLVCPLRDDCVAHRDGLTEELPQRAAKKARKVVDVAALWLEQDGSVLMEKRPETGLLQGMWQLPAIEMESGGHDSEQVYFKLTERLNRLRISSASAVRVAEDSAQSFVSLAEEQHIFTHVEWKVKVYRPLGLNLYSVEDADAHLEFFPKREIHKLVLPRVYEKIFESILGERMR